MKNKTYAEIAGKLSLLSWTQEEEGKALLNEADEIRGERGSCVTTAREVLKQIPLESITTGPIVTWLFEWARSYQYDENQTLAGVS